MGKFWAETRQLDNMNLPARSGELSELRENIQTHGCILPVYYYEGRVLDGNKRAICCRETGIEIERVTLTDRTQAARLLWSLHQSRAHQMFALDLPLSEACALLGARPSEVVALRRKPKIRKTYPRPVMKELRAYLSAPETMAWNALIIEHHCSVSEAIRALTWVSQNERVRDLFRAELQKLRSRNTRD